jgi:hypothetical protein
MATSRIEQYAASPDTEVNGGVGAVAFPPLVTTVPTVGVNILINPKTRLIKIVSDSTLTSGVGSSVIFTSALGVINSNDFALPINCFGYIKIPQEEAQTGLAQIKAQV